MATRVLLVLALWPGLSSGLRRGSQQQSDELSDDRALLDLSQLRSLAPPAPYIDIGMADVSGIEFDVPPMPDRIHATVTESVFWAGHGTAMRMFADTVMPWYLKYFGTVGERAEYTAGVVVRWMTEHPGKSAAAAAAVVATSGLFYYWYRSSRARERAVQQALEDVKAMRVPDSNKTISKALDPALDAEGLIAAQAVLLSAGLRGDCQLKWMHVKGAPMKEKELLRYLRNPQDGNKVERKSGPMVAKCGEQLAQISWSHAKELVPQLRLLGLLGSNITALA